MSYPTATELNYNDRKRILFKHFESAFPTKNEYTIEELFQFLDFKVK